VSRRRGIYGFRAAEQVGGLGAVIGTQHRRLGGSRTPFSHAYIEPA
jgi:hypothetical protein